MTFLAIGERTRAFFATLNEKDKSSLHRSSMTLKLMPSIKSDPSKKKVILILWLESVASEHLATPQASFSET